MSHSDVRSAGRSGIVPYRPDEDASERHARRLAVNVDQGRAAVEAWCADNGIGVTISNGGHHWRFDGPPGWCAEWWPSSAKLVIGRRYDRGVHVHDYQQAIREIERSLRMCA